MLENTNLHQVNKLIGEHLGQYTNLLDAFKENFKNTFKQKLKEKNIFFIFSLTLLGTMTIAFAFLSCWIIVNNKKIEIATLTAFVSAFASLLSLYIIFPKIIAEYLFNKNEDDKMVELIKGIQEHDMGLYSQNNVSEASKKKNKKSNQNKAS